MNIEKIESGPSHLDRTGEEWWDVPPTHVLDGHRMIYNGSRVIYPNLQTLWNKQDKRQQALEQALKDSGYVH